MKNPQSSVFAQHGMFAVCCVSGYTGSVFLHPFAKIIFVR